MKKDYWSGSQGALRSNAAYAGRELGRLEQLSSTRGGYAALAVGFATVVVGSVGATILAMSLLAGEGAEKVEAPEQAVRASIAAPALASDRTVKPASVALNSENVVPLPASPVAQQLAGSADQSQTNVVASLSDDEEIDALASNDPRWAQGESPAQSIDALVTPPKDAAMAYGKAGDGTGGAKEALTKAITDEDIGKDPEATAAIAARKSEKDNSASPKPAGRTATLNTDSNLRSGPDKNARIVGTVPARVQVQIVSCKSWCEIVYKGKRGYVYSGFVGKAEANATATVRKASAEIRARAPEAAARRNPSSLPGVAANILPKARPPAETAQP